MSGSESSNSLAHHRFANPIHADSLDLPRPSDRPRSPEKKIKISGPSNGVPIGADFKRRDVDRKAKVKSSFWDFAGRRGNGKSSASTLEANDNTLVDLAERKDPTAAPSRPVFGVPLQEAVEIARVREDSELPAVIFRCVQYLTAVNAENEEGIYRLSGSSAVIKALKDRFNAGERAFPVPVLITLGIECTATEGDFDLTTEYFDPHAVAGVLKSFFRELPQHIFTSELNPDFIHVNDIEAHNDKVKELTRLVTLLPVANYTLLRFLSAHLVKIANNESINKMNVRNIGIVFSPTLAIPASVFQQSCWCPRS